MGIHTNIFLSRLEYIVRGFPHHSFYPIITSLLLHNPKIIFKRLPPFLKFPPITTNALRQMFFIDISGLSLLLRGSPQSHTQTSPPLLNHFILQLPATSQQPPSPLTLHSYRIHAHSFPFIPHCFRVLFLGFSLSRH